MPTGLASCAGLTSGQSDSRARVCDCATSNAGKFSMPGSTSELMWRCPTLVYMLSLPCMPLTNASARVPVRSGSSPYVSEPRPQRGSRNMLMLGAKAFRPLQAASASQSNNTTHGPLLHQRHHLHQDGQSTCWRTWLSQAERWDTPAQLYSKCDQAAAGRQAWQHAGSPGGIRGRPGPHGSLL